MSLHCSIPDWAEPPRALPHPSTESKTYNTAQFIKSGGAFYQLPSYLDGRPEF
jgi:hypothetical protein